MATSLVGPVLTDKELLAAPPPRPPHPIRATDIVSPPAAWTCGIIMPAKADAAADAAAILPEVFSNSRRDMLLWNVLTNLLLMMGSNLKYWLAIISFVIC